MCVMVLQPQLPCTRIDRSALGAKEEELAAMRRDLDAAESDLLKARQELGMTGLSEEKLREAIRAEAQEEAKKSIEEATREANERCEALEVRVARRKTTARKRHFCNTHSTH